MTRLVSQKMIKLLLCVLIGLTGWTSGQDNFYCPGEVATLSCMTSVSPAVVWDGSAFTGQCPLNMINIAPPVNVGNVTMCGIFTVTIAGTESTMDGGFPITIVNSTLTFVANSLLNGENIRCRTAGAAGTPPVETQLTIPALAAQLSPPTQLSLTAVTVNLVVNDSQCVSMYSVELTATDNSQLITESSSTSSFTVSGLKLCCVTYSAVGYVETPDNVEGTRSSPVIVPVDLSALQGVERVVVRSNLLEWIQISNNDLDYCITNYTVSWSSGGSMVVSGLSVSAEQLSSSGFPFCQNQTVTVTPMTAVGSLSTGSASMDGVLQHPDFRPPMVSATRSSNSSITISWQMISTEVVTNITYGLNTVQGENCDPQIPVRVEGNSVNVETSEEILSVCVMFLNGECTESATVPLDESDGEMNTSPYVCDAGCAAGAAVGGTGVVIIVILIPGVGVIIYVKRPKDKKSKSKNAEKDNQTDIPPPDSLYADPNSIEHQTTAGGDEYAMVAVKGKKKDTTTQEAALYQDPNTIQHETAPSGETYAVVDKPKRGSSKKKEPDVVPSQGAEGLNYADIDVAGGRRKPKPAPQHPAQDPGRVEYSIVGQEQARL